MSRFIIRILINAAALWVAAQLLSGITLAQDFVTFLIVALVFGLINALLKPILTILSLPFIIITLGLFTLVVNALLLLLVDALTDGLTIAGFWWAVLGSIVISIVSMVLNSLFDEENDR
ncbi:MAG: phage holin family protein [Anaerolineales bacterium]|nr:phage holin family protein [Anaerolineales bacterium]